jgi:hypothetical protein
MLLNLVLLRIDCRADLSGSISGNPQNDGWTYVGKSATTNFNYSSTANSTYNVDIYTAAFTISSGSPLITTQSGYNWKQSDTVVGVGGIFDGANPSLKYNSSPAGSTSTRIVVKYGTSTETWSPGTAALANGGVGAVLLGTAAGYFYPANSGTLVAPLDAPTEQSSPSGTSTISGYVGRVETYWSGSTIVGFESFLDLTLLKADYPSTGVALGNQFILDMQDNTLEYQDSQGALPGAIIAPVPEPSMLGQIALMFGLFVVYKQKRGPAAMRKLVY